MSQVGYVRLGKSGLRGAFTIELLCGAYVTYVSELVLGCMSYGDKRWAEWVLEGDEAVEHMKVSS